MVLTQACTKLKLHNCYIATVYDTRPKGNTHICTTTQRLARLAAHLGGIGASQLFCYHFDWFIQQQHALFVEASLQAFLIKLVVTAHSALSLESVRVTRAQNCKYQLGPI